jgi:hypothetical protein
VVETKNVKKNSKKKKVACNHGKHIVLRCKNLSFYFSLYFEGSPQQKIHRELCGGRDPTIFLCSHVLMERFFDGMDDENSKTQGAKGQIRKIQKNKKERMEERKRRDC